ncbi:hypothetical protein [Frederiksenia canicola]
MKFITTAIVVASMLTVLSGCRSNNLYATSNQAENIPHPTLRPTAQAKTKRLNTIQCHDLDDWYLDGYRVGKSFAHEKHQMLQQRMHFCQFSKLPQQFAMNWERGFHVGHHQNKNIRKNRKI